MTGFRLTSTRVTLRPDGIDRRISEILVLESFNSAAQKRAQTTKLETCKLCVGAVDKLERFIGALQYEELDS